MAYVERIGEPGAVGGLTPGQAEVAEDAAQEREPRVRDARDHGSDQRLARGRREGDFDRVDRLLVDLSEQVAQALDQEDSPQLAALAGEPGT